MITSAKAPVAGTSLSDILTAAQNIVKAVNGLAQNYMNVQGVTSLTGISVPTVVKAAPGRLCRVSITTAGSAPGMAYDGATLQAQSKPIWVIPEAQATNGEPYEVQIETNFGLLIIPGTGQSLAVTFS